MALPSKVTVGLKLSLRSTFPIPWQGAYGTPTAAAPVAVWERTLRAASLLLGMLWLVPAFPNYGERALLPATLPMLLSIEAFCGKYGFRFETGIPGPSS